MGLLDFNVGELASRIVRGGASRGRVPLTLDDQVIPTVKVGDWSQSPYRLDERRFFGTLLQSVSGAAQFTTVYLNNNTTRPIIVEYIRLQNRTVGTLFLHEAPAPGIFAVGGAQPFWTGEGVVLAITAAGLQLLPGVTLESGLAGAPFGANSQTVRRIEMISSATPPAFDAWDNVDLTIPAGWALTWGGQTANQPFGVSVRIRAPQQISPNL